MHFVWIILLGALGACSFEGAALPVECADGLSSCDATCVDLTSDVANCGECGVPCNAGESCSGGQCFAGCAAGLAAPITDAWGTVWDGIERDALPLDAARATCAAFGARLPTATELYRVRATDTSAIATIRETRPLWSSTANDTVDQAVVRISDGIALGFPFEAPLDYRCVCVAPTPPAFTGLRCNGPAASPCFALGKLNVDTVDRPALRKSAAVAECAHDHAHLADLPTLVEAIQAGVPGSGRSLPTADQWGYNSSTAITWTTPDWTANDVASVETATEAPFRCAGWSFATGTHPNVIADEFVVENGAKADANPRPLATWITANDTCVAAGGHLPRASELAELVAHGLPNGGAYLWSADQTGLGSGEFLVSSFSWSKTELRSPYMYPQITWLYKSGSYPFRCIYYPIDPAYLGPEPTACSGGCFPLTLAGASPAMMWIDNLDRPAALMDRAVNDCRLLGGHLASERDLTEAIRAGLANGSGANLLTSELGQGSVQVVKFLLSEPTTFDDLYATGHMGSIAAAVPAAYRCMWTNELR